MKENVVQTIVASDLCIGCGVCAGLCPDGVLSMKFNQYGEYNPVLEKECEKKCGLCLKVCPFSNGNPNEDDIGQELYGHIDGIHHRTETGYYLETYVGYSHEHRLSSASGGMATWLLESLISQGLVDHVVCVTSTGNPEKLFQFTILSDISSIRAGSGSVYYPVELSGVLKYIIENPGKYAITGLPCFIKAIRLTQNKNQILRERIQFTIGITCGQMKSKSFTEYVSLLAGVKDEIKYVRYRGKNENQPATNYFFSFKDAQGDEKDFFWNQGISEAWVNRWFTPNACNYCDDVFAECADITFMDAWLQEYSKDFKGTNLIIVRSSIIQNFIRGIDTDTVRIQPFPIEGIIQSQLGIIQFKKTTIGCRLAISKMNGLNIPSKRSSPKNFWFNVFSRKEDEIKENMQVISRKYWADKIKSQNFVINDFRAIMDPNLIQLTKWRKNSKFFLLPLTATRFIRRKIRGLLYG